MGGTGCKPERRKDRLGQTARDRMQDRKRVERLQVRKSRDWLQKEDRQAAGQKGAGVTGFRSEIR
jgi:hypothetical protein